MNVNTDDITVSKKEKKIERAEKTLLGLFPFILFLFNTETTMSTKASKHFVDRQTFFFGFAFGLFFILWS